ncbi:MAG: DUF2961 domain-containing protein [Candidatus Hydrogenedentes bacterium]|nr:DUF2961 domain-containing protein [Candidatus Hydrogenedentota bacterium]
MISCLGVAAGQDALQQGLLADLPRLKNFEAARVSSHDPTGGNADGRHDWPLQPGETREIANLSGAGAITHIWMTIASKDERHLKNLVLRMYWDGEAAPSVESPIGDFFGLGNNRYYQYASLPIQIGTDKGLNCFWRMPFGNGARAAITNDGPLPCIAFYYYIDYQRYESLPENTGRFHAQYRQEYPCIPMQDYVLLDVKGRGHYVGCNLSIHLREGAWWGEGDDRMYVDGADQPQLHGTGAEDYFCGAWAFGESSPKTFGNLYFGCPLIDGGHKRNALWNVYRYHLEDPVPFRSALKVSIEHGHANDRKDDYASVAYWYQTEPHVAFPPLPKAADRVFTEATTYTEDWTKEAEALAPLFQSADVTAEETLEHGNFWSGGAHLSINATGPAVYKAVLPASPSDAGEYLFEVWYTAGPDYGESELWSNGKPVCKWDGYNKDGVIRKKLESTFPLTIDKAINVTEIRVTGKNDQSKGYKCGWDCFRVTPR